MNSIKITALIGLVLLFAQCQNEEITNESTLDQEQNQIPENIITGLQNMGFDTKSHEVYVDDDYYVVEGDIAIAKTEILEFMNVGSKHQYSRTASCRNARNITVRNYLGSAWNDEVRNAMRHWSNVNNGGVNFRLINSGNADISIRRSNSITRGQARHPRNGRVGNRVLIDLQDFFGSNRNAKVRSTIEHELGHTLGFNHTNGTTGSVIPGVRGRDSQSLMNPTPRNSPGGKVRNLSNRDKRALRKLYGSGEGRRICR